MQTTKLFFTLTKEQIEKGFTQTIGDIYILSCNFENRKFNLFTTFGGKTTERNFSKLESFNKQYEICLKWGSKQAKVKIENHIEQLPAITKAKLDLTNKEDVQILSNEIAEMMQQLANKYGLAYDRQNGSYGQHTYKTNVLFKNPNEVYNSLNKLYNGIFEIYGIAPDIFGKTFTVRNETVMIIDYNKRKKLCFKAIPVDSNDPRIFSLSLEHATKMHPSNK